MKLIDALRWVVREMILEGYKLSPSRLPNTGEPKLSPLPAPIIGNVTNPIPLTPAISDKQNGDGCLLVTPSLVRGKTEHETKASLENAAVLCNQN